MDIVVDESPSASHLNCPHCNTQGFPITGRYATSVCGTTWNPTNADVLRMGPACYVIEAKNDLIEERDARINELVAALAGRVAA